MLCVREDRVSSFRNHIPIRLNRMWPTCEVVFHEEAGISQHNSSSHASNSRPRITTESPTTHPKLTCSVERRVPFLCAVELWSLRLLNERQNQFCRFTYWAVKPRRGRTQVVFRFRFLFSASSPSSWEPCWERHSRLAWPIGPCCWGFRGMVIGSSGRS